MARHPLPSPHRHHANFTTWSPASGALKVITSATRTAGMTGMDLIALAPWVPWVLFAVALAVIFLRLRRSRRPGADRNRREVSRAGTSRPETPPRDGPSCEPRDRSEVR